MQFSTQPASARGISLSSERARAKRINVAIWTVQVLLACVFLFAGGMKLVLPIATMTKQMVLPGVFTPIAAGGLVIIMSGATAITMLGGNIVPALAPFTVGLLAGLVLYVRTRVVPIREKVRGSVRRGYSIGVAVG